MLISLSHRQKSIDRVLVWESSCFLVVLDVSALSHISPPSTSVSPHNLFSVLLSYCPPLSYKDPWVSHLSG